MIRYFYIKLFYRKFRLKETLTLDLNPFITLKTVTLGILTGMTKKNGLHTLPMYKVLILKSLICSKIKF